MSHSPDATSSDTPRTDAQHAKWRIADDPYTGMVEHARQLERELAATEACRMVELREAEKLSARSEIVTTHATWNAAMERAAEICDANLRDDPIGKFGVHECARDIRASKLPLPTPPAGMEFPERATPSAIGTREKLLATACSAAFAFIDSHVADPDITDEMCIKHETYMEARRALEGSNV